MKATDYLGFVGIIIFVGGGIFGGGWLKILKETNSLLKEQNAELKAENLEWRSKHTENVTAIAGMQGQIDVLKSIPLVNIDTTLKQIAKFNKETATSAKVLLQSNKEILSTLKASAEILKTDTAEAATKVEGVKTHLAENE